VPACAAGGASGDADDFEHMLNEMEDYKAPADDGGDSQSDAEPGGSDAEGGAEGAAEKKAKRRRKRGAKLSSLEFQASREMAKQIAECSAEEQADWLWASYQQQAAAVALERGGLTATGMAPLPAEGALEDRLKTLQPRSWQQEFCGRAAGGGGGSGQQQEQQRPAGSPSLLLVSPSAMGAVNLTKLCPQFNRSCRFGKLFAKHMKVAEQEEALRTQVGG
jgi:hypothetical protein